MGSLTCTISMRKAVLWDDWESIDRSANWKALSVRIACGPAVFLLRELGAVPRNDAWALMWCVDAIEWNPSWRKFLYTSCLTRDTWFCRWCLHDSGVFRRNPVKVVLPLHWWNSEQCSEQRKRKISFCLGVGLLHFNLTTGFILNRPINYPCCCYCTSCSICASILWNFFCRHSLFFVFFREATSADELLNYIWNPRTNDNMLS